MTALFEQALNKRAYEYAVIPTSAIPFCPELIQACEQNVCGNYNRSWSCPPAIGSPEAQKKIITSFSSAFIFTTMSTLDDSFDYEGMMRAKDSHNALTVEMRAHFGKTHPVYGAGACTVCKPCAYPAPCRFPEKALSSLEAAAINVSALSRAAGIRYNNGENTVTFFSMILF